MALTLTGIKTAAPKERAKSDKPVLPDPTGELAEALKKGIEAARDIDSATGVLEASKGALSTAAERYAWPALAGRHDIEDTFQVNGPMGKALITLKNKYKLPKDLGPVKEIVPERYLRERVSIFVDITETPEDSQQAFLDALVAVALQFDDLYGVSAFTEAISAKPVTVVAKSFHEERHTILTPEQNSALHRLMPCEIAVKLDH